MGTVTNTPELSAAAKPAQRAGWLKTLHQWHWISSALCLVGLLVFAATGITLNHAAGIESQPVVVQAQVQLPAPLIASLALVNPQAAAKDFKAPLPKDARDWLATQLKRPLDARVAEWSVDEVYLALARPGGDAWLRIDRNSGAVEYESTDRGWISYLNDLHKGRHTGLAWSWFIDIFAAACLVFSLSGLLILKFHALNRPSTWPLVGLGLLLPALLALLLIH